MSGDWRLFGAVAKRIITAFEKLASCSCNGLIPWRAYFELAAFDCIAAMRPGAAHRVSG
jgi:hypothetical protein